MNKETEREMRKATNPYICMNNPINIEEFGVILCCLKDYNATQHTSALFMIGSG
jgi:hypothetical protein